MLTIKKKGVPPPASIRPRPEVPGKLVFTAARVAAPEPLTTRQEEALDIVGLKPKPKLTANFHITDKYERIAHGERIVITNDLFVWVKAYQAGDTGTVVKYHPAPKEARGGASGRPDRQDLYRVELDKPRVPGSTVVTLCRWEIQKAK